MHINGITISELSKRMGVSREHLSKILNCKVEPEGAEIRVWIALTDLIKERENAEAERAKSTSGQSEGSRAGEKAGPA